MLHIGETVIQEISFGKKIKVILTQMLFPVGVCQREQNFVVHYIEQDEEPIEYQHDNSHKAKKDFDYLSKIAKKETGGKRR
ncbi:hypothetical protein [Sulfurospirillum multivorans]|uniref:Uncharacterized protein n=2 Tax=Sulfurospirillum multivorans TaxID=66821 RepID=A0AA86DYD5_SULMK|nr:hypothetical protein [Sulfurospirillum multivorans]AHJ13083.1 hypothetical protein SMUL_1828 [Sulfurospirillum multivorans DSM 12446]QEH06571.1 hypothetical protein SMN_1806 [Sulfurospirillum multivorans]